MFTIDPNSPAAPFEQLRRQILDAVSSGAITPNTRLPPVRQIAADLGIAANTAARTYRELEQEGIIETHGRNGTFVSAHGSPAQRRAQAAAAEYVALIHKLNLNTDDALKYVSNALSSQQ